jgi:hypothetical protein
MKALKLSLVILAAASITIGLSGMAYAFHTGGVADCDGCHTMHNSLGGKAMGTGTNTKQFQGVNWLLKGSDQSSTCLNCHATTSATPSSYHIMTSNVTTTPGGVVPSQMTPGGDFGWMLKSYPAVGHAPASPGSVHGHNIIAADYNLLPDTTLTTAPGSNPSYLSSNLYCSSCHDPHSSYRIVSNPVTTSSIVKAAIGTTVPPISASGSYAGAWPPAANTALGVYRLLGGIGYVPMSYSGGPAFINPPPLATAPTTYNQAETTYDVRVAYGTYGSYGMAEWCANCHLQIYNAQPTGATTPHIHPTGVNAVLSATANISGTPTTIMAIYNAYIYSGNLSGSQATSYTSLVPYEDLNNDLTWLGPHASNTGGYLQGPVYGTEHVMCLTCHRAHASGFNQGTRWNMNAEFETVAGLWPDSANSASSGYSNGMPLTDYTAAMYNRLSTNYASYQRVFCNKCHGKD